MLCSTVKRISLKMNRKVLASAVQAAQQAKLLASLIEMMERRSVRILSIRQIKPLRR